ncbi:hypothetical protein HZU83_22480 [Sphaerotilus montanus]|uniref:Uncharacterized protein n=1 Tax=Sphaerotilus montanus TaxID=522889 RepID=A0A7Y9R1H0_9BURK|nr:hypothetical protein [Sphaerotilus montanus]NYG35466.1 hypothetical protein [Sphaerotilus montanus]NZD59444.1 hypothetical protein [Sphaerotilus montanus]
MNSYTFLLSDVTKSRALAYMTLLQSTRMPGSYLAAALEGIDIKALLISNDLQQGPSRRSGVA